MRVLINIKHFDTNTGSTAMLVREVGIRSVLIKRPVRGVRWQQSRAMLAPLRFDFLSVEIFVSA